MRAIKAIIDNGKLTLLEPAEIPGRHDALIVVADVQPSPGDAAWSQILRDSAPRPALDDFLREAENEIASGATEPLDLDRL
jgi:hypothetical protein